MRIHFVPTMTLVALSMLCRGQDKHKVDSLEKLLMKRDDHAKVEVLFELTRQFYENDYKRALDYAEKARNLVMQLKVSDSLQYVRVFRGYGLMLQLNGRIDQSINVLSSIEPIALRHGFEDEYKKILTYLALSYTYNANFPNALKYNFKVLSIREKSNDSKGIAISLNNIGLVYMEAYDHTKALEYLEKCLALKNKNNDRYDLGRLLINMGLCYAALNRQKTAREFIIRGLNSCDGTCNKGIQAFGARVYARTFDLEANCDSARKYYLIAYQFSKEVEDQRQELYTLLGLGRVSRCLGNSRTAVKYFLEVDSLDAKRQYPAVIAEAYSALGDFFYQIGDFRRAGIFNQKYKVLQDTLYFRSLRMTAAMGEVEAKRREGVAKIEAQNRIIALNEEVMVTQQKMNVIAGIAGVLAVGFIGLLFYNIRQRKNVNSLLEARVKERTREFESSYDALWRAFENHRFTLVRTTRDLKEPLLSLQGINSVAKREIDHPRALDYFKRMDVIVSQLHEVTDRLTFRVNEDLIVRHLLDVAQRFGSEDLA